MFIDRFHEIQPGIFSAIIVLYKHKEYTIYWYEECYYNCHGEDEQCFWNYKLILPKSVEQKFNHRSILKIT